MEEGTCKAVIGISAACLVNSYQVQGNKRKGIKHLKTGKTMWPFGDRSELLHTERK